MEDSTALDPGPEGPAAADDGADDTRTLAAVLPAVVAVVVTHDPGPWFEEALTSLVTQDYPNLSVLVLDNASAVDPTPRIAAVAPRAFVRRLDDNRGPGHAVNVASTMVEGAPFFLVCHDDVALAPNTVRLLVEEAYRSNAGVVGPKLVEWDRPEALLAVGMGADRFGVPFPLCERGELDQEQHDAVRDVFFVPGACFLIRSDLLSAVGGFDEEITLHGEDTDLCWRIHLAGARVLVAPAARVRHVEALGERRADDRRRLQMRHRLRMVATNYRWFHLLGELVQEAALSLVELVLVVLTGRFRHAADLVSAWVWNARRVGSIVAKRRKSPTETEATAVIGDIAGRNVLLVDDLTETAGTLTSAAALLKSRGAEKIIACVSHALLTDLGVERIKNSPIDELITTDTVLRPVYPGVNVTTLSVAQLLGEAIKRIHHNSSVTSLFEFKGGRTS
ncbi:MAG: ribose-phosphate diphosphokinase [Actinomycetes bacterium]